MTLTYEASASGAPVALWLDVLFFDGATAACPKSDRGLLVCPA